MREIWNGDCLELMKDIQDGTVDMICCDLPYGCTACAWDVIIPFEPLWEQYKRVIKPNGAIVLTATQPFTSIMIMSNLKMFKYCLVWAKSISTGFLQAKMAPLRSHEDIVVFYSSPPTYNPQKTNSDRKNCSRLVTEGNRKYDGQYPHLNKAFDYVDDGTRFPKSILTVASERSGKSRIHPTQKPVALFEYLIRTYTNEGDLVLDNCAGSGTTGVACARCERDYILIERDQEYFDLCKRRTANAHHNLFDGIRSSVCK